MRCLAEKKLFVKCLQLEFYDWLKLQILKVGFHCTVSTTINLAFGGKKKAKNTICFKGFILWVKKSKHYKFNNVSPRISCPVNVFAIKNLATYHPLMSLRGGKQVQVSASQLRYFYQGNLELLLFVQVHYFIHFNLVWSMEKSQFLILNLQCPRGLAGNNVL